MCCLSRPIFSPTVFTAMSPRETIPLLIAEDSLILVEIRIVLSNNLFKIGPESFVSYALEMDFLISSRISSLPITIDSKPEPNRN